ncbi:ribosome small subunit-dependent GTPase A [Cohnella luojiensis]|uniref:Small ribosomal subunit biogenesis GTPase RsgA n=1 Tax=Cohnella luojiensis TaxID=652876 RepID=A0A4Y8LQP2_9BACL|nr:ribosome small subunit-dependent GTPase A [Cohnella luojiensis]TFE22734.1 ribosome small subunit-dependent GTPase A [Cohnella luojiensis]
MNTLQNAILQAYGWNTYWDTALSHQNENIQRLSPARVVAQFSHSYNIMTESGEHSAIVTGKFEFLAAKRGDYPSVGDWVMVERLPNENRSVIHAVLPRRTAMVRKAAGNVIEDQIIGANLDYLFIVNALNQDFNVRKIERFLVAAWDSGAQPVVLLTKADLCDEPENFARQVENVAPGVPVHFISALLGQGKEALGDYLRAGITIGVTGSSGVGKSTLLNWLAGKPLQEVQGIREADARGRHTTTHRELFLLENGALVMDTPGMRELQLWEAQDGWEHAFADIEELAAQCRYRDCKHDTDQGCAVIEAVNSGALDAKRFSNYKKTARELAHLARKENASSLKTSQKTQRSKPNKSKLRPNKKAYLQED